MGYSLCKILHLGQKSKLPKTCYNTFCIHIGGILCKKPYKKKQRQKQIKKQKKQKQNTDNKKEHQVFQEKKEPLEKTPLKYSRNETMVIIAYLANAIAFA